MDDNMHLFSEHNMVTEQSSQPNTKYDTALPVRLS